MNTVDILITNGIIITLDSKRRIIDGGTIAIKSDRIIDIGASGELEGKYGAERVIDATKMVVLPGMINCHTHAGWPIARGVLGDIDLIEAHNKVYFPIEFNPVLPPEDAYIGTLLGCLEYIRTGTTCIVDQFVRPEAVAEAVKIAGIRGTLSGFMFDTWHGSEQVSFTEDKKRILDDAVKFIEDWNGQADGRIQAWFAPIHEMGASRELFTEVIALADEYKVGITTHLAESYAMVQAIKRLYNKRPIEYAYELGLLRPGTIAGHCCWLSEYEITLLAESGASVAHTARSEMKIADGVTPVPRLLEAGANVVLASDSCLEAGDSDLFREMSTAGRLHKVNYPLDPEVMPAEVLLEMVTVNASKAMMFDKEIGSLEKGKKADIILVDFNKPHLTPILRKPKFNVVSLLADSAVGNDVDTMIVNGNIIMLHRKILTLDETQIMEDAQVAAEKVMERTGVAKERFPWRWSI